jgi:hypothetical protein
VTSTLSGVTYTLPLPAGYRLVSDESYRQLWSRADGEGIIVEVQVRQHGEGERCSIEPRRTGELGTIAGIERETEVGVYECVRNTDVTCMVKHSRGYLEADEVAAARDLCIAMKLR